MCLSPILNTGISTSMRTSTTMNKSASMNSSTTMNTIIRMSDRAGLITNMNKSILSVSTNMNIRPSTSMSSCMHRIYSMSASCI